MSDGDGFDLSRRKLLGGLGLVGAAMAGTRMGTTAYFSDAERFDNNRLVAGDVDLRIGWTEHYAEFTEETTAGLSVPEDIRPYEEETGVPEGFVGFPQFDPVVAVNGTERSGGVSQFMGNTAVETTSLRPMTPCDDLADEAPSRKLIDLSDVKPGDFGEITFDFALCTNPGYVWMNGGLTGAFEGRVLPAEREDPDEDFPDGQTVELLEAMQAAIWYDDGSGEDATAGDNVRQSGEEVIFEGSFEAALEMLSGNGGRGIPLDGDRTTAFDELEDAENDPARDCFAGTAADASAPVHSIGFTWWVPLTDGEQNEIQTDRVEFELGFYTEQCRHNDGEGTGDVTGTGDPVDGSALSFVAFGRDETKDGADSMRRCNLYEFTTVQDESGNTVGIELEAAPQMPDVVVMKAGGYTWNIWRETDGFDYGSVLYVGDGSLVPSSETESGNEDAEQTASSPLPDGYVGAKFDLADDGTVEACTPTD